MNLSERDRRAVILGGIALGIIGVYFLGIEPAWNGYTALLREHRKAADSVRSAVNDARQLAAFQKDITEWEQTRGPLVPTRTYGEQVTALGSRIIAAAGESGLQLQAASPGAPVPWFDPATLKTPGMPATDRLEQALINIDGQGEWESIFKFIAALYRIDGVLSVESMDLTGEGKGGSLKLRLGVSVLMKAASEGRKI